MLFFLFLRHFVLPPLFFPSPKLFAFISLTSLFHVSVFTSVFSFPYCFYFVSFSSISFFFLFFLYLRFLFSSSFPFFVLSPHQNSHFFFPPLKCVSFISLFAFFISPVRFFSRFPISSLLISSSSSFLHLFPLVHAALFSHSSLSVTLPSPSVLYPFLRCSNSRPKHTFLLSLYSIFHSTISSSAHFPLDDLYTFVPMFLFLFCLYFILYCSPQSLPNN